MTVEGEPGPDPVASQFEFLSNEYPDVDVRNIAGGRLLGPGAAEQAALGALQLWLDRMKARHDPV